MCFGCNERCVYTKSEFGAEISDDRARMDVEQLAMLHVPVRRYSSGSKMGDK